MNKIFDLNAIFFDKNEQKFIDLISASLEGKKQSSIPSELKDLLLLTDGLICGEFQIFGINAHKRPDKFYTLPEIVDYNNNFNLFNTDNKLIFGCYRDCFLMYLGDNKTYCLVTKIGLKIRKQYKSLLDLLNSELF